MKWITMIMLTSATYLAQVPQAYSQDGGSRPGKMLGLHLTETGGHYGVGLHANTGGFSRADLAVRVAATLQYYEIQAGVEKGPEWSPFGQFRVGLANYTQVCDCGVRAYGEAGLATLVSNKDFSDGSWRWGGYGLFGIEFLFNTSSLFFFEMGGQGMFDNSAPILPGNRSFGSGFIAAAGYRIQFVSKH